MRAKGRAFDPNIIIGWREVIGGWWDGFSAGLERDGGDGMKSGQ